MTLIPSQRSSRLAIAFSAATALTGVAGELSPSSHSLPEWVPSFQLGYLNHLDSDLDSGGEFSLQRAHLRVGASRLFDRENSVGVSLNFGYSGYDFSPAAGEPWSDIYRFGLSVPIRKKLNDDWSLFALPTFQSTAENGADFSESLTAGVLAGASYRVGDHLSIGPGIGVANQLEESVNVFPILLINWKLNDHITLATGRGFGASQGPGVNLEWQANEQWKMTLGCRYEKLRFRLDENGPTPSGIGEDKGVPIYLGASYALAPFSELSLYAGVRLGGELSLEDKSGDRISRTDHDSAFFSGISWKVGF